MSEHSPNGYLEKLYQSDPLQDLLIRQVVRAIGLPRGSRGLDAGCGVGLQIRRLAEAVGLTGHITGLDIRPEFLAESGRNLSTWGLEERVSLVQGDIYDPPFDDREFDWIWSASCACYALSRPLLLLKQFRRLLKPGGPLLILIWSGQQLLPGFPRLEARLNSTTPGIAPFTRQDSPEHHFLRLTGWMRKAGFEEATAKPFTEGVCAPLSGPIRDALLTLIRMRWPGAERELSGPDRRLFRRLIDPESPDFILNLPDYYGFYTYTLFSGVAPQ